MAVELSLPKEPRVSLEPRRREASCQVGSCCWHNALSLLQGRAHLSMWGLLPLIKCINKGETLEVEEVRKGIPRPLGAVLFPR